MKSFIDKYKPSSSKDIPQNLEELKALILKKEKILLYGPTGVCKTSAVYAIAKENDLEIIEVNASDFRTKEQIETIVGNASKQQSLFNKEKIILIDEVDCLAGREDWGGAGAILNVMKETNKAMILTANDLNNDKIKDIKKNTEVIEFKPIPSRHVISILTNICNKEGIIIDEEPLKKIAVNSNGDIRAAINDLESNLINNKIINSEEQREYSLDIMTLLNLIFKKKDFYSVRYMENIDLDLNEYTLWIDENLPLEYSAEDLYKSYELISKADIFKKRISRWQYWRLMYYQSILLTSGISIVKTNVNNKFSTYKRSMRPLKIWQNNMRHAKRKSIAEKLSKIVHTSNKQVIKNFNTYKNILMNPKIQEELKLEQEEIEYLFSH
jgi:replication factor C large subunit